MAPAASDSDSTIGAIPGVFGTEKSDRTSSVDTASFYKQKGATERRSSLSGATNLSLDDVALVKVQIRDLSVSVNTAPSWLEPSTYQNLWASGFMTTPRPKSLLQSVAADLEPGTLTAILGGSGSGKTTLLNIMAERITSPRLSQNGVVTFNGQPGVQSIRHAYVMQQDILLPTLTVRETLRYSAALRLPLTTSLETRHQVVEEVIRELGLKECADTRIGNTGCSGGERRRVSIGVQLLANPSVLFLDEPTTGLDATSAFQLVRTLKSLARKGRTVITIVHQPRSEIWDLFDNLIVLSKGGPIYAGPISDCQPYFKTHGFPLPPFVNPAEFVIDIAAIDNRTDELEAETTARVANLKVAWKKESLRRYPLIEDELQQKSRKQQPKPVADTRTGFLRQLYVLTHRTLRITYRDPLGMTACIAEAILMGVVTGYIFLNLGRDQAGIRSRQGGLYSIAGLQGYLITLFEVYRMTIDIPTFDRELSDNCVSALPYVLSRRLARLPTEDLPVPFIFSVLVYFLAGYDRTVSKYFVFLVITILNHYVSVSCAMTCVVFVRHYAGASLIANLTCTIQSVACGMFIQANSIPVYVQWLKWTAYNFYTFSAYAGNEFEGNFYDCPYPGGPSNPACQQYSGDYVMESLGFPSNWVARPIIILACFVVLFISLSVIGLHIFAVEMTITRTRASDTDLSAGKEKITARSISEVGAINVGLDKFALALDGRGLLGKKLPRKIILNPITTRFEAGCLNVVMGPSGSGKTSLLNAMALRLRNSFGTKYHLSGKLTFNEAVPSGLVVRSVCSYVCQDDDALLPSLTVRETLRFAAGLRLPSFMSTKEKYKRAEDILMKMGLKDCANSLIGSTMIKGISGGEKRRVSIGIQILTDPRVLMLDEPTSGLDAFTASSIMEVLEGLANEGRTVILTIHQARSDLFKHFENVLLLARGGFPVYSGSARHMLEYFGRHGYDCPTHANPADFALDMITIDLQHDDRETESRARVQRLIGHGNNSEAGGADGVADRCLSGIREADEPGEQVAEPGEHVAEPGSGHVAGTEGKKPSTMVAHPPRRPFNKAQVSTPAELGVLVRKRASVSTALPLLLHRAIINTRRQPELIMARTMQVIGLGAVFTLFFAPLGNDYYAVQTRMGFIQEVGAFYFVGMLQNIAVYPNERNVLYREDDDGVYTVDAFLLAYTLIEVLFEILSCLVFGVMSTFAVGLPRTIPMYFVITFACFGVVSCGESLGIIFNTLFSHTGLAVIIMGIFPSLANSMGGVLSINMPGLCKAVNYLSPIRYALRAVAPYSLREVKFTCTSEQKLPDGSCPIDTGTQVLDLYNFNVDPVVNVACMAACVVIYRAIAWILLKVMRAR
ncbi:hypothetical protein QQS21_002063 [Conoideocrella luteorostrata]|uniref:ABC transporter domain-containing protein n=1 Tax=Conoideocrella luteorostrata TaxID=1105319 RepID=A0AAJ0CVW4_9HYPO|nr:hypothetical protein QQS21_002063 [Conoideocrella luteorostrata]